MTLPNDQPPVYVAGEAVLYSVDAAARLLSCSRSGLWAWIAAGAVTSVNLGRSKRVPASEIQRIVAEGLPPLPPSRLRRRQPTT